MLAEVAARPISVARVRTGAVLLALAVFATGFGQPTVVENFTLGDVAIFGLIASFAVVAAAGGAAVGDVVRRLAVPVTLIALGSLVAALPVGLQKWVVGDFVRDAAVALAFLATIDAARRDGLPAIRLATWALALAAGIVAVHVAVFDEGIRAQATFANPNVAGHFLATAFVALVVLPLPRPARALVLVVVGVGLLRTSSFGALLQAGVGLAALAVMRFPVGSSHARRMAVLGVGGVLVVGALAAPVLLPEDNTERSGLSASRLDRSASGRLATWQEGIEAVDDYPLGAGAGSAGELGLVTHAGELHNEPLAYLVERGVIGFVGFLLLAGALWRLAPPGGGARALLLGFAVSSLVRETSHYRHLWVVLALVLVHDAHRRRVDRGAVRV